MGIAAVIEINGQWLRRFGVETQAGQPVLPRGSKRECTQRTYAGLKPGLFTILLLILGQATLALAQSQTEYGAGYEFRLKIDGQEFSIQTTSILRIGEAVTHDMGRYRLVMRLRGVADETLELSLLVTDMRSDLKIEGGILAEEVTVSMNSLVELEMSHGSSVLQAALHFSERLP